MVVSVSHGFNETFKTNAFVLLEYVGMVDILDEDESGFLRINPKDIDLNMPNTHEDKSFNATQPKYFIYRDFDQPRSPLSENLFSNILRYSTIVSNVDNFYSRVFFSSKLILHDLHFTSDFNLFEPIVILMPIIKLNGRFLKQRVLIPTAANFILKNKQSEDHYHAYKLLFKNEESVLKIIRAGDLEKVVNIFHSDFKQFISFLSYTIMFDKAECSIRIHPLVFIKKYIKTSSTDGTTHCETLLVSEKASLWNTLNSKTIDFNFLFGVDQDFLCQKTNRPHDFDTVRDNEEIHASVNNRADHGFYTYNKETSAILDELISMKTCNSELKNKFLDSLEYSLCLHNINRYILLRLQVIYHFFKIDFYEMCEVLSHKRLSVDSCIPERNDMLISEVCICMQDLGSMKTTSLPGANWVKNKTEKYKYIMKKLQDQIHFVRYQLFRLQKHTLEINREKNHVLKIFELLEQFLCNSQVKFARALEFLILKVSSVFTAIEKRNREIGDNIIKQNIILQYLHESKYREKDKEYSTDLTSENLDDKTLAVTIEKIVLETTVECTHRNLHLKIAEDSRYVLRIMAYLSKVIRHGNLITQKIKCKANSMHKNRKLVINVIDALKNAIFKNLDAIYQKIKSLKEAIDQESKIMGFPEHFLLNNQFRTRSSFRD